MYDDSAAVPATDGRGLRLVALASIGLVVVALLLDAVGVASFVVTGAVTAALVLVLAVRWGMRRTPPGSARRSPAALLCAALVAVCAVVVFVRIHDRNALPVGTTSDLAHSMSSSNVIRELQRPFRTTDTERMALPNYASYPLAGQYLTAYVAWLTRADTGRIGEIVGFAALAGIWLFAWAAAANVAAAVASALGKGRRFPCHERMRWLAPVLGLSAPALLLGAPGVGVETISHYFFQAQVIGMAGIAYATFLLVREAVAGEGVAGELVLASVFVTYAYVQYALVIPFMVLVFRLMAYVINGVWKRRTGVTLVAMGAAVLVYVVPRAASNKGTLAIDGVIVSPSIRAFGGFVVLGVAATGVVLALRQLVVAVRRPSTSPETDQAHRSIAALAVVAPLAVVVASLGQYVVLVLADPIFGLHSSRYYRIKTLFPAVPAVAVLSVLVAVRLAAAVPRLTNRSARAGVALSTAAAAFVALAPPAIAFGAHSYRRQQPEFDPNTYEAARWAASHLPHQLVDSIEVGPAGYVYTVGVLGRPGGTTSALRYSIDYPLELWLSNNRRYLVTADVDKLPSVLGDRLSQPLRILHRVGTAAVVDRGPAPRPWYAARLEILNGPRRTGDEWIATVRVTNTGRAKWPLDGRRAEGGIRLGVKVLAANGAQLVEVRSPVQNEASLTLGPGASVEREIRFAASTSEVTAVFDMVWEFVTWFTPELGAYSRDVSLRG